MSKDGGESAPQESGGGDAGKKDPNASLYEGKGSKKLIRVVTVMAYMFSVSFVAIVLSAYYIFLWQPPNPRLLHKHHLQDGPQVEYFIADAPIILTNDSNPHVERAANVFALEIPSHPKSNHTPNFIMSRSAAADDSNEKVTPILFKKITVGHDVGFNKSLSNLQNSLAAVLRERIANLSEGYEYFREPEKSLSKSKRTTDKLHNKSMRVAQLETNVIDESNNSMNFSAKLAVEETTLIPNATPILRTAINGDGTRRSTESDYLVSREIMRSVERHDKSPRDTVLDEGINSTGFTNELKNNRIQNITFAIDRESKNTTPKLTITKEFSLLSEKSVGTWDFSPDAITNHVEPHPEKVNYHDKKPLGSNTVVDGLVGNHQKSQWQASSRNNDTMSIDFRSLGREWSVSSETRETAVEAMTTKATVVNTEHIQETVPTTRRMDLIKILTRPTTIDDSSTPVSRNTSEDFLMEKITTMVNQDRVSTAK